LHYNTPITIYLSDDGKGKIKKMKKHKQSFDETSGQRGEVTLPTAPSNF
jgi:hypothetical protein